jgi:hypothetical protein
LFQVLGIAAFAREYSKKELKELRVLLCEGTLQAAVKQ